MALVTGRKPDDIPALIARWFHRLRKASAHRPSWAQGGLMHHYLNLENPAPGIPDRRSLVTLGTDW